MSNISTNDFVAKLENGQHVEIGLSEGQDKIICFIREGEKIEIPINDAVTAVTGAKLIPHENYDVHTTFIDGKLHLTLKKRAAILPKGYVSVETGTGKKGDSLKVTIPQKSSITKDEIAELKRQNEELGKQIAALTATVHKVSEKTISHISDTVGYGTSLTLDQMQHNRLYDEEQKTLSDLFKAAQMGGGPLPIPGAFEPIRHLTAPNHHHHLIESPSGTIITRHAGPDEDYGKFASIIKANEESKKKQMEAYADFKKRAEDMRRGIF